MLNAILYPSVTALVGLAYLCNSRNIGKSVVGLWGVADILAAVLFGVMLRKQQGEIGCARSCAVLAVILHVVPLACWVVFGEIEFEFWGIMVPAFVGGALHFLMLVWGFLCFSPASTPSHA